MEQQAKERLTGAVLLVVLLVLLVPELLTGPRPAPPLAPVQPDQAPMRSYTVDIGDPAHAGSAPVAASTAVTASTAAPPMPPMPVQSTTAAPAASNAAAPAGSAPEAPVPAHVQAHVQALAPAPAHAPAHAREPAAAPAAGHSAGHAAATWTVQLGTFSSRENAVRLAGSVKSHGFSASISEVTRNGHPLFRVRVGSERDRAAAQKLLGRLRMAGQKGGEVVPR